MSKKPPSCKFGIVKDLHDHIEAWDPDNFTKIVSVKDYPNVFEWLEGRKYDPLEFEKDHDLYYPVQEGIFKDRVVFKVETYYNYAYQAYRISDDLDLKVFTPKEVKLTNLLYGYNRIVTSDDVLFVVEGIFDVARLLTWRFNAVAVMSCAVSDRQNKWLQDTFASEIVLCFDNGMFNKAFKFAKRLKALCPDKEISVMNIEKGGADPDDLGGKEFFSYYLNRVKV